MRHDSASAAIVVMLRGLKMYGMANKIAERNPFRIAMGGR